MQITHELCSNSKPIPSVDHVFTEISLDATKASWAETFDDPFPQNEFRRRIERHYAIRPPRRYSHDVDAIQVAAYFVILRLAGQGATAAVGVHARYYESIARSVDTRNSNPVELIYRGRAILAGVLAAELLDDAGRWRAADEIEKLLHARFVVARAAEMTGRKKGLLWRHTLNDAGRYVELYGDEIREGGALVRQKNIHELKPQVRAILRRVDTKPSKFSPVSQRCETAFADIDAALREFSK